MASGFAMETLLPPPGDGGRSPTESNLHTTTTLLGHILTANLSVLTILACSLFLFASGCGGDPSSQPVDGVLAHRGKDGGAKRSQIIAAVETSDPATVKRHAETLVDLYGYDRALVNFYDDAAIVSRFNGSGLMLDEKSWIGEVTVDMADGRVSFKPSPFRD